MLGIIRSPLESLNVTVIKDCELPLAGIDVGFASMVLSLRLGRGFVGPQIISLDKLISEMATWLLPDISENERSEGLELLIKVSPV